MQARDNSRIIEKNMAAIIPAAVIGGAVANQLPSFFRDAVDQLRVGEGEYIKSGEPEGVVAQVGQAIARGYCRIYDAGTGTTDPTRNLRIENACRPYLDSIGSNGGPGLGTPFTGGQCPVRYLFDIQGSLPQGVDGNGQCVGTQPLNTTAGVWGPILGFGEGPGDCEGGPGGGTKVITCTCFGSSGGERSPVPVTIDVTQPVYSGTPTNIRRVDNQEDVCGNPPPVPRVPPPTPNPQPPPFRFNPSPNIDIDVNIEVFPDGTFNFDIGTGPITVDPFIDPTPVGGGDGDGDGGGNPDGPPGDVGAPGTPQEPGPGGEASGCAPEGQVLVGIKIDFIEIPVDARQYAEGVYRAVCYAYLGTTEGLDHDPAGAMMRSGQFIFSEKSNLTCWAVRANLGWSLRTTPYYRELEE